MSVPAYLRRANKAEFLSASTKLVKFTGKWAFDDRLFGERDKRRFSYKIDDASMSILINAYQANDRNYTKGSFDIRKINYESRIDFLLKALDEIGKLKVLLTIKYDKIAEGFNTKQNRSPEEKIKEMIGKSQSKKKADLTNDKIDNIFCEWFELVLSVESLINGVIRSDMERFKIGN